MDIIRGLDFHIKNSAVSLGKFDGLHRGHRLLLDKIVSRGDLYPSVFTFEGIFPGKRIYTGREQSFLLEKLGVAREILFPFCRETKAIGAREFVKEILVERMDARLVCVGEDFRFGRDRQGDVGLLERSSHQYGFELCVCPKLTDDGAPISSTRIREELAEGQISQANRLLGGPYLILGEVVHGKALGRTIGMPTANILPDETKLLPAFGVYATRTEVDGKLYRGVTNLGIKPTVGADGVSVETLLLDFTGDLYGRTIAVYFEHYLRPEQKFSDVSRLREQISRDREQAERLLRGQAYKRS